MKKKVLVTASLLIVSLTGCDNLIMDGDGMLKPDDQVYCEERGWEYTNQYVEGSEYGCLNSEYDAYCYIDEIKNRICWPGLKQEFKKNIENYCIENSGYLGENYRGIPICFFGDDTYCYQDDFYLNECKPGDLSASLLEYPEDHYYELIPYAEQACIENNGELSEDENGIQICILTNDRNCSINETINGECEYIEYDVREEYEIHEQERSYQEYVAECYEQEQEVVCGKDGNQYYNRCFMEKAGIEEETELSEIVDGKCIYG